MRCSKWTTCANCPTMCKACEITSSYMAPYPEYVEKKPDIGCAVKFKIFWGNHTNVSADVKLNQWLAENPSVELVEWQYQQVRLGDHSICIIYKEKEK